MSPYNQYLRKHALYPSWIDEPTLDPLHMTVVIPAYAEPDLLPTLQSLLSARRHHWKVEVIVVVNAPPEATKEAIRLNQKTLLVGREFAAQHNDQKFALHMLHVEDWPAGKFGVGLARKIGMDEAVRRMDVSGRDGLILCLDADSICDDNYFEEIYRYFEDHPQVWATGIYFEHDVNAPGKELQKAIIDYELHLRYFISAQAWAGLPFAYHTVGSAMVVRQSGYQKMGGMNRRQAGEDFYFLQKFIAAGRFGEILQTTVRPSPRSSFRVPFGTGKAVASILKGQDQTTYDLHSFLLLRECLLQLSQLYHENKLATVPKGWPAEVAHFFSSISWQEKVSEILKHTTDYHAFHKRFFQWFNAFQAIKYVHYMRKFWPDKPIKGQARKLLELLMPAEDVGDDAFDLLSFYRKIDRHRT